MSDKMVEGNMSDKAAKPKEWCVWSTEEIECGYDPSEVFFFDVDEDIGNGETRYCPKCGREIDMYA